MNKEMMVDKKSNNYRSRKEVVRLFNISTATLHNWTRTAIPNAVKDKLYCIKTIQEFVSTQNKLSKRANKKHNVKIEAPKELLKYLNNTSWVPVFLEYLNSNKETVAQDIISLFEARLNNLIIENPLQDIIPHNEFYAYSVAYQLVLSSGEKSKSGAYYTPKNIVEKMVSLHIKKNAKFLEPCCGVGFFCIEYIKKYKELFKEYPNGLIFANDLDKKVSRITYLNILSITNGEMKDFNVSSIDAFDITEGGFDVVLTNPPYGIKRKDKDMKTTEIFSHFINITLNRFLKTDGVMSLVLPSSVLAVEKHKEIRKILIDNFDILAVDFYGKSFDGVLSDIITLTVQKSHNENNQIMWIAETKKNFPQIYLKNNNYILSFLDKSDEFSQYEKIDTVFLKDCVFALGIVTGNNEKFLRKEKQDGYKRIISGKEVYPGMIDYSACKYILDEPSKYQQKPPMDLFNKKKIVYKFISKRLVTAVDNTGSLTLNSSNFFLLSDIGVTEEYVSALLNSEAVNSIYMKMNGNPLKVLKKSLQTLPIFVFDLETQVAIEDNYVNGRHLENEEIINGKIKKMLA